ncbi:MAG TPA: Hsp33 family molecular chaperone HslO, partial [Clostridiales bacterium]|nr:Hsp33 family molecular chaperone HslO [Clostridiales bacterium]
MKDYVVRAIAADATVRAFGASTLNTVQTAMKIHQLSPASAAALGRALTATALMTKMLENESDKLTIQIRGDGPVNGIVAVADTRDAVRGYVGNNQVPMFLKSNGKIDMSKVTGENGFVNVVKDIGLKEPYAGYVDLVSGEIADDLASYFVISEQIPTAFSLG